MGSIVGMLIGGSIGLALGYVFVFWLPDRRHRKECLRRFSAHVAKLGKYSDLDGEG